VGEATVFQAEVFALEGAAKYAANLNYNSITIFSDSQSGMDTGHLWTLGSIPHSVQCH